MAAGVLSGAGMAFAAALNLSQAPVAGQAGYRSAAGMTASSRSVRAGTRLYQTRFDASDWHGDVVAYGLDGSGGLSLVWRAGALLRQTLLANGHQRRQLLTYHATGRQGVSLAWSKLSSSQRDALRAPHDTDAQPAMDRLAYLRGDMSSEGGPSGFRPRGGALGDLIHSQPLFIGAPGLPDTIDPQTYPAFRSAQAGRAPMLVVGSNDGFVHVFNAANGQELMAYAPNAVFPGLIDLTNPHYAHRYYVDGSPAAADVLTASGWRTWVVGGLGAGGRGIYALDVTDPARLANAAAPGNPAAIVQWEFTAADDPDLGFTFSQPSVVRMQNGRWAALFGNGYNSANDHAVLYVAFLDGGQDGTWTRGVDYVRIPASGGLPALAGTANGLSTPAAVDLDRDFSTDLIYAGDLQGNLWKFDVSSPLPDNWGSAYHIGAVPAPMFVCNDAFGQRQPITTRPEVGPHPLAGTLVYVGTGKNLEPGDRSSTAPQTLYGLWDRDATTLPPYSRLDGSLLQQTVQQRGEGRFLSPREANWTKHLGWFVDLPAAGERLVSDLVLRHRRLVFTSLIPGLGGGWLSELHAPSGGRLPFTLLDINGDGFYTVEDHTPVGRRQHRAGVLYPTADGRICRSAGDSGKRRDGGAIHQRDGRNDRTVGEEPRSSGRGPSVLGARVIAVTCRWRWQVCNKEWVSCGRNGIVAGTAMRRPPAWPWYGTSLHGAALRMSAFCKSCARCLGTPLSRPCGVPRHMGIIPCPSARSRPFRSPTWSP
jgi:type IV pilus assembly protein PilY1